ncbi:putative N-acetyltransferase camello [Rhinophrynus dorsalis]
MANFSIRRYKSSDYEAVRLLFTQGMMEHIPASCFYLLKLPQVHVALFIPFIILFMISKSYTLCFGSLAVLLAAGWYAMNSEFHQYVDESLRDDLLDIEKSYMFGGNSCFWVAEFNGKVVGMVGVQPAQGSKDEMVLRRMSVAKDQRSHGIAKALCMKVIDFTRQSGCKRVTLETSMVQYAAQKLYERLGFQKTNVKIIPSFFGRFSNFSIFQYKYNIVVDEMVN